MFVVAALAVSRYISCASLISTPKYAGCLASVAGNGISHFDFCETPNAISLLFYINGRPIPITRETNSNWHQIMPAARVWGNQ